jgi:hypothetical protein
VVGPYPVWGAWFPNRLLLVGTSRIWIFGPEPVTYGTRGTWPRHYLIAEFLKYDVVELFYVVNYDCSWEAKATNDVLPEKLLDSCVAYVGDRLRLNPLGEILNCYDGKSIVALSWGQWAYYVYPHC